MHSKKTLDKDILAEIVKYYRLDKRDPVLDPSKFEGWECFSHPSLELHDCNIRSRLPGGHTCEICNHIVGRTCSISCDFQVVCLAVFAWRMGIGGDDFKQALHHNLYELRPEELYDIVIYKFSTEGVDFSTENEKPYIEENNNKIKKYRKKEVIKDIEGSNDSDVKDILERETVSNTVIEDLNVDVMNDIYKEIDSSTEESKDEWLSLMEAAKFYGCTYSNIYMKVNKGVLVPKKIEGHVYVNKKDLTELKSKSRRKRVVK